MSARDDEELADLLADLRETLDALEGELGGGRRRRRPPTFGEVLRFTEEYTIPTLIAILRANIRLLELFRRTLRLADPGRAAREESATARDRASDLSGQAVDRLSGKAADRLSESLAELQRALAETDLPENPEARSVIEDARELSAEIERRLSEPGADPRADEGGGVTIAVNEEEESPDEGTELGERTESDEAVGDDAGGDGVEVDVEAELESIKDELDEPEAGEDEQAEAGEPDEIDPDEGDENDES